jgi:trigger factor
MKIEVKNLDKGLVELTIELTVDEYQPFLEQAAKKISVDTKVPGFRPGKANFELIKQKVGENEIWQKALEPAVQKTFLQALDQEKLITVGSPQIDVVKLAPDNPVIYKATVSLLPKVELGDYSKMKVNKKPVEVKDEQFKKAMSNVQKMHAKQTLVDRQAQKGDKVEIDFETFLDKVPIDQGQQKKFPIVIGEGTFIPGFEDQLIGLSKDETKEFQLEFPKNYHQKNMAGRLADFKVKMNAVYSMELPELNDDFAKSLGNFKTIKEIEDKIKDNLKTEAERKENQRLEEEIIDKIIDQSKFDEIPDLLIDSETKKMVQELEQNLVNQGLKFEDYLNHLKKKREDLFLDFVPQGIKRIKSALTIRKIREKENIKVDDKEIEAEIEKIKTMYAGNPEIEKNLNQPAYRDYLQNILAARKVIEHLKSVMVK